MNKISLSHMDASGQALVARLYDVELVLNIDTNQEELEAPHGTVFPQFNIEFVI